MSTLLKMQKSIRFAADTSECIHCKTDGLFCDICSVTRISQNAVRI